MNVIDNAILRTRILEGIQALFAARDALAGQRTSARHYRTLADVDREFIEGTKSNRIPCAVCHLPIERKKIERTLRRGRPIPKYCDRAECKRFRGTLRQRYRRLGNAEATYDVPADSEPREWPVYHGLASTSDRDVAACIYDDARRFSAGHLPANLIPERLRRPLRSAA